MNSEHQTIRRNNIGDAFSRAVARHNHRTALIFSERIWSFTELMTAAERVAAWFLNLGLKPGDRIAAYGGNSDAFVILWLACARGGFVHVPINYALVGRELHYILSNADAVALFCDSKILHKAHEIKAELPDLAWIGTLMGGENLDILEIAQDESILIPATLGAAIHDDDLVQLLYTSGTTAAPKGAMLTHRALLAEYDSAIIELSLRDHDISLAALPLYHSAQMHVFTMPHLLVGAVTYLIESPNPERCLKLIETHKINSFFAPPTVWISLLRDPYFSNYDLSSLQYIFYGASIMPVPVLQEMRTRLPNAKPYNCYGQSEIGPLATVLRPEDHDERPASAGRPVFNVQSKIVDEHMREVPPGIQGEIVHRSPQLLLGYWKNQSETDAAFKGGWFHSGDVGVADAQGYITVIDRVKDIIKTGGTIVSSREVEEEIFRHPAVKEVAVVGLPHLKWIEAVTAFVVVRDQMQASEAEILEHLRPVLAAYKLPKQIIFVDEIPRNMTGKILKRELRLNYKHIYDEKI